MMSCKCGRIAHEQKKGNTLRWYCSKCGFIKKTRFKVVYKDRYQLSESEMKLAGF